MNFRSIIVRSVVLLVTALILPVSASAQAAPPPSVWAFCSSEGGSCVFAGTKEVRYGANGSYYYRTLSGGTACTNSVFGDPLPGMLKQCSIDAQAPTTGDWTFCASEGGSCAFSGTKDVRYGANGSYYYRTLSGGTACTNSVFGDPLPGSLKQCSFDAQAPTTGDWTLCSAEGGSCLFAGSQEVRYGATGFYYTRTLSNGTACTNSVFGDPAPDTAKHCDIRAAPPPPPPSDWVFCSAEGGSCAFAGTKEVRYGATGFYYTRTLSNGTACTNTVFSDPAVGTLKHCDIKAASTSTTLTGLSITGSSSVTVGQTAQYTARAVYSDGSLVSMTTGPVWSTSNSSRATITQAGVLTAIAAGAVTVQAGYGGLSAQLAVSGAPTLVVSCPANMSVPSTASTGVAVTYSVTTSGGLAPVTVTGSPASGQTFPVGATAVSVTARASDGQTASCGFSVTVTYSSTSLYGPQSTILCPAGAIDVWPGTNIQTMVNTYGGATTFCLRAGVHSITSAITPKTGNTFVGEYGAVLDGSGWATTDPNQAAFRAHNEDINNVTIRNLLIRKMPQRGIHAYYQFADGWTVEYNEITATQIGVAIPNNSVVRNNYIHHNSAGGFNGWKIANTTFDTNEVSYNGPAQKIFNTTNVVFRNNFVHHNTDGIHYDSDNADALIEGNRVEDNGRNGIFYEASHRAVIRNNTVSRNGDTGIFLSMSKNVETYGNTLQDNFRAIQYFLNCDVIGGGAISFDLANNSSHDNTIRVDTTSGAFSNALTMLSSCSSTAAAPYLNGSKNLTFQNNHYTVPYIGRWWVWGFNGFKFWNDWQGLPQDSTGTVQ